MDEDVRQAMLELSDRLAAKASFHAQIQTPFRQAAFTILMDVATAICEVFEEDYEDYDDEDGDAEH